MEAYSTWHTSFTRTAIVFTVLLAFPIVGITIALLAEITGWTVAQESSVWTPFWSSLASGATYSTFTGTLVAAVVAWMFSAVERSAIKRGYILQVDPLREYVLSILDAVEETTAYSVWSAVAAIPSGYPEIYKIAKTAPLRIWGENAPEYKPMCDQLQKFQVKFSEYLVKAEYIDISLANAVTIQEKAQELHISKRTMRVLVMQTWFGEKGSEFFAFLKRSEPSIEDNEAMKQALEAAGELSRQLESLAQPWISARAELATIADNIRIRCRPMRESMPADRNITDSQRSNGTG